MRSYFALAAGAAAIAVALTGCSSTTGGAGHVSSAGGAASSGPSFPSTLPASAVASTEPHGSAAPPTHVSSSAATSVTRKVIVRPVDAAGRPVSGYTVETEAGTGPVTCSDPSPVAVDPNIRMCSPSAAYAVACWRSSDPSWVLCLRDPLLHMLARLRLAGSFTPVAAPAHPSPQRIVLPGEISCVIRDGGAWDPLAGHPQWAGAYGCNMRESVYGPANTDGIDRSSPMWTVHEVPDSALGVHGTGGPISVRPIRIGYFVGTSG